MATRRNEMSPDEDLRYFLNLLKEGRISLETLLFLFPVGEIFLSPTAFILVVECRNPP
jgi:hypothetical protein